MCPFKFAAVWALFAVASPLAAQPIISEFMADNSTVLADEDGAFEDWIELHNPGAAAFNLGGLYLTDDAANLTKWRLPAHILPAGGYVVIFASQKNRTVVGAQLHANFKLDAGGEFLALVGTNGTSLLSSFGAAFPKQYPDISYGHQTQGTNVTFRAKQPGFLVAHTPGTANVVLPGPHPLYCDTSLARIEITASQSVWDGLQAGSPTSVEGPVNVRFRHGDIDVTVTNCGISARGNTSLTKYPRSFNVSFNSFVPGQDLFGIEKLNLNAESNDPSSARSKICFDLANAAGLPSPYANHVATVILGPNNHRPGPNGVFFDAVLNNTQPVDDVFVAQRFANTRGNLYKCTYPANLTYKGLAGSSYSGLATYELKYQGGNDASFNDLAGFINLINNTPGSNFAAVIRRNFEVDDFLKRLALDVLTANWDGHWGNWNNFYLYRDPITAKWNYIAYDQDNTFDIRWITAPSGDWATQNMYSWGNSTDTPLVSRILGVAEFRNRYSYYMNQLVTNHYQTTRLGPVSFHVRSNLMSPLPFNDLAVTNCKQAERSRYLGDWPNWTYTQFTNSFDKGQVTANGNVPNYRSITEFVAARRSNVLSQLTMTNIGPLISALKVAPPLPSTNQPIVVTARVEDDVSVGAVQLITRFNGNASVTNTMLDNGAGADTAAGDGVYSVQIGPFGSTGTLTYYLQATDNTGKSTFEPWGGAADTNALPVGSPYLGLVISEINYHPHEPFGPERAISANPDDFEFIELWNRGSSPINLSGLKFIAGISFTFPAQFLAPDTRAVLAKNTASCSARYGASISPLGPFDGQLSNGGEELHLADSNGVTILRFTYQDTAPWPERPDGKGSSLVLLDPLGGADNPACWRASVEHGGSPGLTGLTAPPGVVINEVLTHTDPPLVDAIELHNPSPSAIDIGGWFLSDTSTQLRKFQIPPGTVLAAGAYLTFTETNHFNTSLGANTNDFSLDAAHGDDVWLIQAGPQSNLVAFVDQVSFGAARNGESFGRWPNATGELYPAQERTFGAANSGPRVGPVILSELMYLPGGTNPILEFVEIMNAGLQPENLTGWRIGGDIDYTFPTNTLLMPGAVAAVLPFNPALPGNSSQATAFRAHYGLGTGTPLIGAFLGSLPDSAGRIRLYRPDSPPPEEPNYIPWLIEDEVNYAGTPPWPVEAASGGQSLQRRAPDVWGNDPQSWQSGQSQPATPGVAPLADGDGDGLPDSYEIETYGGTNTVGSPNNRDTDGDGASDTAEYAAGTIATNAASKLTLSAVVLTNGSVVVRFQTQAILGSGYFGRNRLYHLEQATQLSAPSAWSIIPGLSGIPATGATVTFTNQNQHALWAARVRVTLD